MDSTIYATQSNGTPLTNQRDFAYGRIRNGSTLPTDHWFTGQQVSSDNGLYYYGARYYDPEIGQFISPDSLVPDATNVVDYNRYMYARGNPIRYNDPSGHCATNQDGSRAESDAQCWQIANIIGTIWDQHPHYWEQRFKVSNANWQEKVAAAQQFDTRYMNSELGLYLNSSSFRADNGFASASYTPNPMGPQPFDLPHVTAPDCNKVDCTSLLINNTIVGLDKVSVYAASGVVGAQSVAFGCAAAGFLPCVGAAEGVDGTLGTVSTVASVAGTGLTAVQVVRNKAPAKDLAVSLTSTLLGAQGSSYLGNAGASDEMAKLAGAATGFGASLLQYQYDTK
ncbi:hypothetical protein BH10CHL1_BH10CHL1_02990 [soil metagenome]